MMITQAPSVNLVAAMTRHTTPDTNDPRPLITRPVFHFGSLWVMWCLAMPAWLSVNERNTPIAYSGIRRSTLASVTTSSTIAVTARKMIPFENTSRWPRLVSWRGMKSSPAWKFASRGKSAKLVLAARIRISIVPACSM